MNLWLPLLLVHVLVGLFYARWYLRRLEREPYASRAREFDALFVEVGLRPGYLWRMAGWSAVVLWPLFLAVDVWVWVTQRVRPGQ